MSPLHSTVAIVGAGFSGTVAAVHLLRSTGPVPLRILLIDPRGEAGRGVAYSTTSPCHVLNVPAGRMSAFAGDEDDFLRFAKARDVQAVGGSFVPRRLYGEYLATRLDEAVSAGAAHGHVVEIVADRVSKLGLREDDGVTVELSEGSSRIADHVLLALGNFAPADPPVPGGEAVYRSPRYIRDPWSPGALDRVPHSAPVLLVGTGLTMLDVAVELASRGRSAPLHALSRRGLVPLPHRPHGAPPSYGHLPPELIACEPTAVAYLRAVRRHVRALEREGIDWREVVASLRPVTPRLWETLSEVERRRFLRHARPYWDVHRHRVAPDLHRIFESLRAEGALRLSAGRIARLSEERGGIAVTVRPRGGADEHALHVSAVVNCTGPESDVRHLGDPLLDRLLQLGEVRADPLGLGLEADARGRMRRADGSSHASLWLAGPLLKGSYWEATAVPELRVHAARAARGILEALARAPQDALAGP